MADLILDMNTGGAATGQTDSIDVSQYSTVHLITNNYQNSGTISIQTLMGDGMSWTSIWSNLQAGTPQIPHAILGAGGVHPSNNAASIPLGNKIRLTWTGLGTTSLIFAMWGRK